MLKKLKSFNAPEIEEKVLEFWDKKKIFKKTLKPKKNNKGNFYFWEGPPYANGRPGIHHILSRVFKDVFLRYKTMQGYVVPRKAGWDTHGLPIEIEAEKSLGIKSKKDIEKMGIDKFNIKAKEAIFKYKNEWERLTNRIGYWLDLKNAYMTYMPDFVESLWWVFSEINKRGNLKEFYKVVPYCPRCQTALSSHELGQPGVYQEVKDPSVFIKFPIKGRKKEYILVWTTTPWTLPANVAIAFDKNVKYKKYKINGEFLWAYNIPNELLEGKGVEVIEEKKGKEFDGIWYEPLFKLGGDVKLPIKIYEMHSADFISIEEGTGFVHIAPSFGEDDFNLIFKDGISEEYKIPETVDEEGKMKKGVIGEGLFVKDADKVILEDLKNRNLLFSFKMEKHEYPHCWRCGSPLLYFAQKSWFFEMSKLRDELVKTNEKVNWIPEYIKYGRFGEWISQVRDWAVSRNRYWGTPLPIWKCEDCEEIYVAGSLGDLNKHRLHNNEYFIMRHGEADANVGGWIASGNEKNKKKISHLTNKGIREIEELAKRLSTKKIDIIFTSPHERTKKSAEIIAEKIGTRVVVDKNLKEIEVGKFNWRPIGEYKKEYPNTEYRFNHAPKGGETLMELKERIYGFIRKIDRKYNGKRILIVSHGDVLWMLEAALRHMDIKSVDKIKYIKTGEFRKIKLDNYPTDKYGNLDIHRPYIDSIKLKCENCDGKMERVPDVADVWFDSGSMPYASIYFPFDKKSINKKAESGVLPRGFPADFIAEGIDQTRGWFYTLMAISVLLGFGVPYHNVISLGLVLDKHGKKMSKSKGNVVDPWSVISRIGADAIRWYFYTITSPAEPKNFDVDEVIKTFRRFMLMLYNSYSFLNLYGKKNISINKEPKSDDILDKWILAVLKNRSRKITKAMDGYDVMKACQNIEALTDDLSRWYIRRSRRRFQKPKNVKELEICSSVLAYVLLSISKIIAPFIPFFAEALYQSLKEDYKFKSEESVHLDKWVYVDGKLNKKLIEKMTLIRDIASKALAQRSDEGIKVRQPLSSLRIKKIQGIPLSKNLLNILKEELNVKRIELDDKIKEDFILDTKITKELKVEGRVRELTRMVQGLRQDAGYMPHDRINVWIESDSQIYSAINNNKKKFMSDIGATKLVLNERIDKFDAEAEITIDGMKVWASIKKVK